MVLEEDDGCCFSLLMMLMMEGEWDAMNYKISKNVLNFEREEKKRER